MTDADAGAAAPETPPAPPKPTDEAIAALQASHDDACRKLDALKIQLATSFEKAKGELGHFDYHGAYVRDIGLKVDEIAAWIARGLA